MKTFILRNRFHSMPAELAVPTRSMQRRRTNMRRVRLICLAVVVWGGIFALSSPSAWAVASFSRRYGVTCSACHTTWGALNIAGITFRLSGYRAMNGRVLEPVVKDIPLAGEEVTIPATLPFSIVTGVGLDYRSDHLEKGSDATRVTSGRTGFSFALEDISIFLTTPIGKHLAIFAEFPMYETHAERGVTGPGGASTAGNRRNIQFDTENPIFEVAKMWWNNVLPESWGAPRDSMNFFFGVSQLFTPYAVGKVRLSVTQFLVYERQPLELISRRPFHLEFPEGLLTGKEKDRLFKLTEPQILFEVNGMLVPGRPVTDVSKPEALWLEYHLGITNGSNIQADPNTEKDFYGRLVARWWGQSLGVFAYYSPNTYDSDIRDTASIANGGIMRTGRKFNDTTLRVGPDFTLSLVPWNIPVYLENQILFNRDGDPTGFGKSFSWWGGLHQLNCRITKTLHAYGRYDWIRGQRFNDTAFGGVTDVHPKEWDAVGGLQFLLLQNFKLTAEYRYRKFTSESVSPAPSHDRVTENFFTIRASFGF